MTESNDSKKLTTRDIMLRGTIIGLIVTIPSLATFGIIWYVLDDLFQAAIIGAVVHFIALGFSFKIAKKFFVKKSSS